MSNADAVAQRINQAGLELIKQFEGLRLTAYQDSGGVWTIGYGHTGPDVRPGMTITRARAEQLLENDLREFERGVSRLVRVPLNSNQFSALVSFAFNVGLGNLQGSTLLRLLNRGDYAGAAAQFGRWVRVGSQVLAGLVRRRHAERQLFLTAVSGDDWFASASAADLERTIRKVLNEGTAYGQKSWAGTSKATLDNIQRVVNLITQQVIPRLGSVQGANMGGEPAQGGS